MIVIAFSNLIWTCLCCFQMKLLKLLKAFLSFSCAAFLSFSRPICRCREIDERFEAAHNHLQSCMLYHIKQHHLASCFEAPVDAAVYSRYNLDPSLLSVGVRKMVDPLLFKGRKPEVASSSVQINNNSHSPSRRMRPHRQTARRRWQMATAVMASVCLLAVPSLVDAQQSCSITRNRLAQDSNQ